MDKKLKGSVNPDLIPKDVLNRLARWALKGCKEFFNDPENVREFEEWQKQRNKSKE